MFEKIVSHRLLYLLCLVIVLVGLPLSKALMSIGMVALAVNWVLEGNFKDKWQVFVKRKSIWFFLIIYLLHIIGLIYSSDMEYGLIDIRKKVALFIFPLVIGTSEVLSQKEFKRLLQIFILSVCIGTIVSMLVLLGFIGEPIRDIRDISIFVSHIRFSLMINLSIVILGYFVFVSKSGTTTFEKVIYIVLMLWLIVFLGILKSFTGIVVFGLLLFATIIYIALFTKILLVRIGIIIFYLAIITGSGIYINKIVNDFYNVQEIDPEQVPLNTAKGNPYAHDFSNKLIENGNYTWIFICEKELEEEWTKMSEIPYQGADKKGQTLKYTLIRYLTSKGLTKDAEGITQLSEEDIKMIEEGIANHIYKNKFALYPKLYELIWQIDRYYKGTNPSGHSVTMRLEYLRTAKSIISDHFWMGVGTGDVSKTFKQYYHEENTPLASEYRHRAHNQLVTFFLTFGVFGFLIICFALFYPVFKEKGFSNFLFVFFLIIAVFSMLDEDTLENHAGVIFFSTFYALLLFAHPIKEKIYGEKTAT